MQPIFTQNYLYPLVSDSVILNPTSTTSYTVTSMGGSCIAQDVAVITVNNTIPALNLTSNNYSVCNGASDTLQVSGAITYTWAPASTLNNPNIANPIANPTTPTIYTVTGTNACGMGFPVTLTVNIKSPPTLSLTSNSYITCYDSSQNLSVSGAITYTWVPSNTLNNPNTANPIANPTTPTIYTVTGTNACGLSSPATLTVNVISSPILSLTSDSYTVCKGASDTLQISGASTYTWLPANTLDNPNAPNPITNPTTTTVYTVNGTNNCGIGSPLTLTVNVKDVPALALANDTYTLCLGSNGNKLGVSGADTYTWVPATGLNNPNMATPLAHPTVTTIYTVTGSNICGISSPLNVIVYVNPTPTLSIINNIDSLCTGSSDTLSISGANTYTWIPAIGLNDPNSANPVVNPTATTIYTVTGTNACGNSSTTTCTIAVSNNIFPAESFYILPDSIPHVWDLYIYYSANVVNARWYWGDGTDTLALYASHVYNATGNYNICVTAYSSCGGDSSMFCQNDSLYRTTANQMIKVKVLHGQATDISQLRMQNDDFRIYPNPTNSVINVQVARNINRENIQVTDILGNVVIQNLILSTQHLTLDVSSLSAGVYFVRVGSGIQKFVKE
jgi:hypothetical protein